MASIFSLSYIIGPFYIIAALYYLIRYHDLHSLYFALPFLISAITPPVKIPTIVYSDIFGYMKDYFSYEEIFEISDNDLIKRLAEFKAVGRSIIFTGQPHGVLSYGGLCAGANMDKRLTGIVTAVAGAVLMTPVIKHVVGVFGLIDASAKSLKKQLAKGGVEGSIVLYTGGIAELFKCSETEEKLFLLQRKGFIKLALREGADIVPMYFFGNTTVLTIPKVPFLETISRAMQMSITIFWGRWGLPIPRPHKVLYVRGKPLGLPRIANPTDEQVTEWHTKYCKEVQRIFDTYKHKVPQFEDKKLVIE